MFGGGGLFRSLLDAGLVDTVEIAVIPVLLGDGIPLLPPGAMTKLKLSDHRILPESGIVVLSYAVAGSTATAPPIRFIKAAKAKVKAKAKKRTVAKKRTPPAKKAARSTTRPARRK